MQRVLDAVPVDHETKAVLLGRASRLRPLYELMLAREAGDWVRAGERSRQLKLSDSEVAQAFWHAIQWARQINAVAA
jgi:c-di-GMP-related signal transduction protein